jgi:REP element-mobilizing transposase RayT
MLSRQSLSSIIREYKGRVSHQIHKIEPGFGWQSRFYDHIIRNEKDLQNIRDYIINNPIKWFSDKEIMRKGN